MIGRLKVKSDIELLQPRECENLLQKEEVAASSHKKEVIPPIAIEGTETPKKSVKKKTAKLAKNEVPANQQLIKSFFKSCTKSFKIEPEACAGRCITSAQRPKPPTRLQRRKASKRLFGATIDTEPEVIKENKTTNSNQKSVRKPRLSAVKNKKSKSANIVELIDLCSDSDAEHSQKCSEVQPALRNIAILPSPPNIQDIQGALSNETPAPPQSSACPSMSVNTHSSIQTSKTKGKQKHISQQQAPLSDRRKPSNRLADPNSENTLKPHITWSGAQARKARICPSYKCVDGTSFAVDAFQFGRIAGVTHYFLTHFHADHYVGLSGKFDMPLYLSPITARLVSAFIPVKDEYMHQIGLNDPIVINTIEVTAINANHCPGAVMFVFKLPCGRCILHTGDFRACPEMESEPIFWNYDMHTIYLDTTYISGNYSFCRQMESIERAIGLVREFQLKNPMKKILYVCGSYVIGKENFWSAIANEFNLSVWTDSNRKKALDAMQVEEFSSKICDDALSAQMHVISIGKVSYTSLVEYFRPPLSDAFDILLALRPSGWEKNSRPQYRGRINIIGVEYSEHSSHNELKRFVSYLNPCQVISTVPVASDPLITAIIPEKWYNYEKLIPSSSFQPTIRSYLTLSLTKTSGNITKHSAQSTSPVVKRSSSLMNVSEVEASQDCPLKESLHLIGRINTPLQRRYPIRTYGNENITAQLSNTSPKTTSISHKSALPGINLDAEDDWLS